MYFLYQELSNVILGLFGLKFVLHLQGLLHFGINVSLESIYLKYSFFIHLAKAVSESLLICRCILFPLMEKSSMLFVLQDHAVELSDVKLSFQSLFLLSCAWTAGRERASFLCLLLFSFGICLHSSV
jgi:hypothetical protein